MNPVGLNICDMVDELLMVDSRVSGAQVDVDAVVWWDDENNGADPVTCVGSVHVPQAGVPVAAIAARFAAVPRRAI